MSSILNSEPQIQALPQHTMRYMINPPSVSLFRSCRKFSLACRCPLVPPLDKPELKVHQMCTSFECPLAGGLLSRSGSL